MQDIFISAIAYGLALILTPWVIQLGVSRAWVDQPNARKMHQQPMVRLGGVAILTSLLLSLALFFLISQLFPSLGDTARVDSSLLHSGFSRPFWGLLVGAIGFFAIGAIDDLRPLSPFSRLAGQALVGSVVWSFGIQLTALPIPGFGVVSLGAMSLPITLIWLAGIANGINWLDGLDGLASSVVITIELVIFGLLMLTGSPREISYFCLATVGATLGFLYHNAHPAKLFMGDGGSYLLGFVLGATSLLPLAGITNNQTATLPFVLLALPILDMGRVILRRLTNGHSPFYPDRGHIHHLLIDQGFSQRETVSLIVSLSLWLSSAAMPLVGLPGGGLLLLATSLSMLLQWAGCIRNGLEAFLSKGLTLSLPLNSSSIIDPSQEGV